MISPPVSVIIPCFNDGHFLPEAIESIVSDPVCNHWEIVVVNDGSTDPATIGELDRLDTNRIRLIQHSQNRGLAAARNTGIREAQSNYILPLDADNKIIGKVFAKALDYLGQNEQCALVYTDHTRFGAEHFTTRIGTPSLASLFMKNDIDACCLMRKELLLAMGGYDGNMPVMGNEDWELIIRLLTQGYQLHYLAEPGFYYRVHAGSMYQSSTRNGEHLNRQYLVKKYIDHVADAYWNLYGDLQLEKQQRNFLEHRLKEFRTYLKTHKIRSSLKLLLGKNFGY